MKEYCIYIRCGKAEPFILQPYRSYYDAKVSLLRMVDFEKERGRAYYVGNEFYKNEFPAGMGKFMQIKCRDVSSWFVCEEDTEEQDLIKIKSKKIVKIY